ncbi:hypothetical protein SNEBB_009500 [Seison nebaliae]|nr:hypothetical protein SNEBB_009500 [Seison nebaliae]
MLADECLQNGPLSRPMTYYDKNVGELICQSDNSDKRGLLGITKINGSFRWIDDYKSSVYDNQNNCQVYWTSNKPDLLTKEKLVIYACRNSVNFGFDDHLTYNLKYFCMELNWTKKSFYLQLPNHQSSLQLKHFLLQTQNVDPKLLTDRTNCYKKTIYINGIKAIIRNR